METTFIQKRTTTVLLVAFVLLLSRQASRSQNLDQLIPGLYGGHGITLGLIPDAPNHAAHFSAASGNALEQLNSQLSRSFASFPFNASAGSFAFSFDRDLGAFVNTSETLGPIFAERTATLGRGKWNVSFYGTFFHYDTFNGQHLDNLHIPVAHDADEFGQRPGFRQDVLDVFVNVDASVRIFSPTVTYGVTEKLDITALLPIVSVDMKVNSFYTLVANPNQVGQDPHDTNITHGATGPSNASGSSTGIGDLVLEAKYRFYEGGPVDLAAALLGQFATGDERNFQGTGDNLLRPFLIASHTFRRIAGSAISLTPHVNLGYQADVNNFDRSSLEYATGFDVGIKKVGMAADLLGRHFHNGDNRIDFAVGARWNVWKKLVLSGNVILPLNDAGVRSDVITTLGIGATF